MLKFELSKRECFAIARVEEPVSAEGWATEARKITNVVHDEAQRNGLNLRLFAHSEDAQAWVSA